MCFFNDVASFFKNFLPIPLFFSWLPQACWVFFYWAKSWSLNSKNKQTKKNQKQKKLFFFFLRQYFIKLPTISLNFSIVWPGLELAILLPVSRMAGITDLYWEGQFQNSVFDCCLCSQLCFPCVILSHFSMSHAHDYSFFAAFCLHSTDSFPNTIESPILFTSHRASLYTRSFQFQYFK